MRSAPVRLVVRNGAVVGRIVCRFADLPFEYHRQVTLEPIDNPGSDRAVAHGCCCAVEANNRGSFAPGGRATDEPDEPGWWVSNDCPIHWPRWQVLLPDKERAH